MERLGSCSEMTAVCFLGYNIKHSFHILQCNFPDFRANIDPNMLLLKIAIWEWLIALNIYNIKRPHRTNTEGYIYKSHLFVLWFVLYLSFVLLWLVTYPPLMWQFFFYIRNIDVFMYVCMHIIDWLRRYLHFGTCGKLYYFSLLLCSYYYGLNGQPSSSPSAKTKNLHDTVATVHALI
jgi:hypothetical protein